MKPDFEEEYKKELCDLSDSVSPAAYISEMNCIIGRRKPPWFYPSKYPMIIEMIKSDMAKFLYVRNSVFSSLDIFDKSVFRAAAFETQECVAYNLYFGDTQRKITIFNTPNSDLGTIRSSTMNANDRVNLRMRGSAMIRAIPASIMAYLRITLAITPETNMSNLDVLKFKHVDKIKYHWLFTGIAEGQLTLLYNQNIVIAWNMVHYSVILQQEPKSDLHPYVSVKNDLESEPMKVEEFEVTDDDLKEMTEDFRGECSVTPGVKRKRKEFEDDDEDKKPIPPKKSKQ